MTFTLLVTGANDQLGKCLRDIVPSVQHKFIFTDVAELDITLQNAVPKMFDCEKLDWIINCTAYISVDKAESDQALAERLNTTVAGIMACEAEKIEIGVVSDKCGLPTSANDLAKAIFEAIEKSMYGTYHFSNEGITNRALFAEEIMKLNGLQHKVNHIATIEYPTPAQKPEYSLMSEEKFKKIFGTDIPEWEISIQSVITSLEQN